MTTVLPTNIICWLSWATGYCPTTHEVYSDTSSASILFRLGEKVHFVSAAVT